MKKKYEPEDLSFISKRDAVVIGKELDRLATEKGKVTPKVVLADASDPKSPLHKFFEWDDEKAAEKHRLFQARKLIKSVRVTFEDTGTGKQAETVRAFVRVHKKGYQPVDAAMGNKDWREDVIEQALRDIQLLQLRYERILKVAEFFAKLEDAKGVLDRHRKLKGKAKEQLKPFKPAKPLLERVPKVALAH